MWSRKCPVGEMSVRGNVLVGKCPVGEVSFGEVSGRGIVRSGKCPSGKFPSRKCQLGNWPRGSVSRGTVQSGNCPVGELSAYRNWLVVFWEKVKNCNGVLVSFTGRKIKLVLVFISKMTSFVSGTGSVPLRPCFVFIFKNPVKAIFFFDNSNRHSKYSLFISFFAYL